MKRHVIVPDVQIPFQENRQVNAIAGFIKEIKPDAVHQVGDLIDHEGISRWVKGRRGEFKSDLRKNIDETKRILEKLQVTHWKRGNHDERLDKYVEENAPGIASLLGDVLSTEELFGLNDLGVTYYRGIYEMSPGLAVAHGDEGPISGVAGQTALKLAQRIGKSVVCGHTHRAGISKYTESFNGVPTRTLTGVEVGNCMDLSKASYLKGQYANWQSAFAVIDTSNSRFQVYLIDISQTGSFTFEGVAWEDGRPRVGKKFKSYAEVSG